MSKNYQRFFIFTLEKTYCKTLKIEILVDVFAKFNASKIFKEMEYYTRYPQLNVAVAAVKAIGKIGLRYPNYSGKAAKILTKICKRKQKKLVAAAVLTLTQYLYLDAEKYLPILVYCIKNISQIEDVTTRQNIVSHLCGSCEQMPTLAIECLRELCLTFCKEPR